MLTDLVHNTKPLSEKRTGGIINHVAADVVLELQPCSVVGDHTFEEVLTEVVPNLLSCCALLRVFVPCMYNDTRKKV